MNMEQGSVRRGIARAYILTPSGWKRSPSKKQKPTKSQIKRARARLVKDTISIWIGVESARAVSKGKRPEITEFMKTKKSLKRLINDTINRPPEKIETYKGIEVWYNPKTGRYEAKIGNRTRKLDDLEKIHIWIDK
jgi:hypothetical protein